MKSLRRTLCLLSVPLAVLAITLFPVRGSAQSASPDRAAGAESAGRPRIIAVEEEHDFGLVEQGSKVSHTFVLRNEGDAPLKIIRAKGS